MTKEMMKYMQDKNFSQEDINEVIRLEEEYKNGCEEITAECEAEGYPANGDNYELRCEELRKTIDEQEDAIYEKYEEVEEMTREQELAQEIRGNQEWDLDQLQELCELAGMAEEWAAADSETFEQVAFAAAEKLGVEIL